MTALSDMHANDDALADFVGAPPSCLIFSCLRPSLTLYLRRRPHRPRPCLLHLVRDRYPVSRKEFEGTFGERVVYVLF